MAGLRKMLLVAGLLLVILGAWAVEAAETARKRRPTAGPGEYYQLYLHQGPKNIPLTQGELTFRTALAYGDGKAGLYGLAHSPQPIVSGQALEIVVFDPESAAAHLRLSRLNRIDTAPAHTFDLKPNKVAPALFEQVYQVKYDDQVAINLWSAAGDIDLRITPLIGKPGWYRAVPEQKLEDGVYAVNFGLVQGPRIYTGEPRFYPFAVGPLPPPPVREPTSKAKRRVGKLEAGGAYPPPKKLPVKARLPEPAPAPAIPELNAGFSYKRVSLPARREYQITNVNQVPWHKVNISIYMRSATFPDLVLGPVSLYKDIVLPQHTVDQAPDKTFLEYETLDDGNCNLYLKISAQEGAIRKAWKNIYSIESGENHLTEIPWDLQE